MSLASENLIYQNGIAIGMDCGTYTSWFSNAFGDDMPERQRAEVRVVQNPPSDQLEDLSAP